MKLVHKDLECQIVLEKFKQCEWIIESPELWAKYVQELYAQSEGKEGNFVLSEADAEISIEKYVEVIINPFSVSINDKKILNRLYSELSGIAFGEEMYMQTQEIQSQLQNYFLKLEQLSTCILTMDSEIDIVAVCKAVGVKNESFSEDFFENLNQYIKVSVELLRKKVVVLVNAGSYMNNEQMEEISKTAVHNEIRLLFLENQQRNFSSEVVRYIIDKDGCEI